MYTMFDGCGQKILIREVGGLAMCYEDIGDENTPGVRRVVDCPKCGAMLLVGHLSRTPPDHQTQAAHIEAIFSGEPLPRPVVPPDRVLSEWIDSTAAAITALEWWLFELRRWQAHAGELQAGEFDAAYRQMVDVLGAGWADENPAGGGLDRLAEVVTGK